jgi:hypothetical protein
MKNLPIILIAGGLLVGGITYFGNQIANKPSSDEALLEAIRSQQRTEQAKQVELSELRSLVLKAPASCGGIMTSVFFGLCDKEPYDGVPAPDWKTGLTDAESQCVTDAFHETNQHAYKFMQQEYASDAPSNMQVIQFACDVGGASFYAENIDYGDANGSALELITAFHTERAKGITRPRDY